VLNQGSPPFSVKSHIINTFGFIGHRVSCCICPALPRASACKQYLNEWSGLCSRKTLFRKRETRIWPVGHDLPTRYLDEGSCWDSTLSTQSGWQILTLGYNHRYCSLLFCMGLSHHSCLGAVSYTPCIPFSLTGVSLEPWYVCLFTVQRWSRHSPGPDWTSSWLGRPQMGHSKYSVNQCYNS